jgi:hypothetical protein
VAERRQRRRLWRDPRLYFGCVAAGLVLGATCPLWPEGAPQTFCRSLSTDLKSLGLHQLGLLAPSSSPDGGT